MGDIKDSYLFNQLKFKKDKLSDGSYGDSIANSDNIEIIYHGGPIEVSKPVLTRIGFAKDFGFGFYCTKIKDQAYSWASRKKRRDGDPNIGYVSIFEYNACTDLNIKIFRSANDEWLDFIVKSRKGISSDYDIVEGPMADDRVYNYLDDYIKGELTKEEFFILAKNVDKTHQIAFLSDKAINQLKFRKSEVVK